MIFKPSYLLSLGLLSTLLGASQSQDFYLTLESPPMQLLHIQPYNTDVQTEDAQHVGGTTPFVTYSFSSNQPDQMLSVALGIQPPIGIQIFMQAQAPEGAHSLDWVELSTGMKPLVQQIPAGCGQDLKIYVKAQAGQEAEAFDLNQMQLRYRFDRF